MTRVALIFGGRSAEHDVSILSARSVSAAAPSRLQITPVYMTKTGVLLDPERSAIMLNGSVEDRQSCLSDSDGQTGLSVPHFSFESWWRAGNADVAFPLIHGTGGEDGTLQGYLETLGAPYVGSGVAASAVAMDKGHMKHAFSTAKLPTVEHVTVLESDWRTEKERISRAVDNALRLPYFVKPANSGSSIGVVKVKSDAELAKAMEFAFRFDDKVLVERGVDARELEISVLGNTRLEASVAGEIVPASDFYDYADKYADNKASLIIPAKLSKDKTEELRRLAMAAFKAVGAAGYARVDFFLERGTNRTYVNEINTIPGFTSISMYPKLWEATELKYSKLIERLVELGIERHAARAKRQESAIAWLREARRIV